MVRSVSQYLVSIRRLLKEEIMGFLALCALAPLFFPAGPALLAWLPAAQRASSVSSCRTTL
jgi:hypothetical protein